MNFLARLPPAIRERIERKHVAYARTFMDSQGRLLPFGQTVLADLKRFCGVEKGGIVISPVTRMADPIATAYRAGQRDVFLRIMKFLRLDGADITEDDSHVEKKPDSTG